MPGESLIYLCDERLVQWSRDQKIRSTFFHCLTGRIQRAKGESGQFGIGHPGLNAWLLLPAIDQIDLPFFDLFHGTGIPELHLRKAQLLALGFDHLLRGKEYRSDHFEDAVIR